MIHAMSSLSSKDKDGASPHGAAATPARDNRELVILNAIAAALNASVDLDSLMASALAQVAELLDLRTGWVFLEDEAGGAPYLAAAQNLPPGLAAEPQRLAGSCYCLETFRQGDLEGAANINVVTCSRLRKLVDGTDGLRFHASIPLYARGKRQGLLNVASPQWRRLAPAELRLLHTVGDLLGVAIERARLYERSLEAGAAEERNRLAREIHDTLAQGLTAITLQLETAEAQLEAGAPPAAVGDAVAAALRLSREGLEEARRSVLDLRAAPLEGRSLTAALAALVEEVATEAGPRLDFEMPPDQRPLPGRLEVGLYRIAQEALANALQHAAAARVTLRLRLDPQQAVLVVEDDGRGFAPAATPDGRFGLVGLRERAKLLGGRLTVHSSPGVGTRVEASVPLGAARQEAAP